MPLMPLKARFEAFMASLNGVESVDELMRELPPAPLKRADYLFANRHIIIEQKSLDSDPGNKIQEFADKLMEERGIVLFGQMTTDRLFEGQDDKEKIKKRLFDTVTKNIRSIVAYADKQTRDTKLIFKVPKAAGILVILNETSYTLDPQVVAHRIAHALREGENHGCLRYPNNQIVILLQEAHTVEQIGDQRQLLQVILRGPSTASYPGLSECAERFLAAWAKYNGMPFSIKAMSEMPEKYTPTGEQ